MITITEQKDNALYYECDCGSKGVCVLKHSKKATAVIVADVICKGCGQAERLTILRYDSEERKRALLADFGNVDLSWVPFFNEEIM